MADYFGAMGTALFSKLAAGTALVAALGGTAIYVDQAPDQAERPFVVFSHQGGGPENIIGGDDLRDDFWWVRAYADTRSQANRIDGLISDLLHRGSLTVTGWNCFWLVRGEDYSLVENLPSGKQSYTAGGMYRIRLT